MPRKAAKLIPISALESKHRVSFLEPMGNGACAPSEGALAVGPARTGLDSARQYVRERRFTPVSGTIKKLVAERGFGFITAEDGNDYFFHRSGTADFDRLDTGVKVSFVTEPSAKGPRATNVQLV